MTADDIIDGLLQREGGWRDQVTRPDGSIDPATNKGITIDTLRSCWGPEATLDDLRGLTDADAAAIYQYRYIDEPGFTAENIPYEPLRVQLIDFGVNSGPPTAIRWLQRVLGMHKTDVDGVLGPKTRERISLIVGDWYGFDDTRGRLVNDALVAARSYMIDRLEDTGKLRTADEEGVESRALEFFLAKP